MEKILTLKSQEQSIHRHRKDSDKRVCDRIKAVLLRDDSYSYSEIAKILLLDDETIRRYIEAYLKHQKLIPENGGSIGKLSQSESRALVEHHSEENYLYAKDICGYIKKTFKKKLTVREMTKSLHANKFCYKKLYAVPAKANREQQKKFIQCYYYYTLKAKAGEKELIYFMDSVYPQYHTHLKCGWILKGERKLVLTIARKPRLNFIGGICLQGHRIIYQQADTINADHIYPSSLKMQNWLHADE